MTKTVWWMPCMLLSVPRPSLLQLLGMLLAGGLWLSPSSGTALSRRELPWSRLQILLEVSPVEWHVKARKPSPVALYRMTLKGHPCSELRVWPAEACVATTSPLSSPATRSVYVFFLRAFPSKPSLWKSLLRVHFPRNPTCSGQPDMTLPATAPVICHGIGYVIPSVIRKGFLTSISHKEDCW